MTPLLAIVRRAAVILVAGAATVRAQSLPIPSDHPRVRAALEHRDYDYFDGDTLLRMSGEGEEQQDCDCS